MKVSYNTTLFSVPKIVRGSFIIIKRCFTKYIIMLRTDGIVFLVLCVLIRTCSKSKKYIHYRLTF